MSAGLHGVLLGGQTKGIPADGVEDIEASGAFITGDDIGRGVALGVADVEARAGRIRKHVEHVVFRLRRVLLGLGGEVFLPERLPVGLDL